MSFQADEAGKNRALKARAYAGETAKEQEKQVMDLFKQTGDYHRLVVPKANEAITEAFNQIIQAKSSGTPFSSNQFMEINKNLRTKLNTLKAYSDALQNFDAQTKFVDRGKRYYGRNFEPFIAEYQKARSIDDLQNLAKNNPQLQKGAYFNIGEDGVPFVNPVEAIPYNRELQTVAKQLKPVYVGEGVQVPENVYGVKLIRNTAVVPFTKQDRDNILTKNPELKGKSIMSIEDLVETYMRDNYRALEQIADRSGIDYQTDSDGVPEQETLDEIKRVLMSSLRPYSTVKQTTMTAFPPGSRNNNNTDSELTDDDLGISKKEETEQATVGNTAAIYRYKASRSFSPSEVKSLRLGNRSGVTQWGTLNNPATDDEYNLSSAVILPYTVDAGGYKRPVPDGSTATVAGYHPFLYFNSPQNKVYVDIESITPATIATGGEKEIKGYRVLKDRLLELAKTYK